MPLAVTHVLTAIILVDIYRHYIAKDKKNFTLWTLFVAGVGGLLPDIDVGFRLISEIFNFTLPSLLQHRGITHTPFFGLLFVIPGLLLWFKSERINWFENNKVWAMYFFVFAFGGFTHILLDYLLGGGAYEGIMWLFPFSMVSFKLHLLRVLGLTNLPAAIDAVLLLAWLFHEERKHNIKDYI